MKAIIASAVFVASTAFAVDQSPSLGSDKLPRYKLQPGQELVYESSSEFTYQGGMLRDSDTTIYWVIRANADGGWHLVAQSESVSGQIMGDKKQIETQLAAEKAGNLAPKDSRKEMMIGSFDLSPEGRVENLPDDPRSSSLRQPLPELPANSQAAKNGWAFSPEPGSKLIYKMAPESEVQSGNWVLSETEEGLFNTIYVSTSSKTIRFDATRGLVTGNEGTNSQDYGFHGKGTSKMVLKSVNTKPQEWIDQLAREAEVLGAVNAEIGKIEKEHGSAEAQSRRKSLLEEGRAKVKLPAVVAQFDSRLQQLGASAKYEEEERKAEEAVMNKPSPEWETTDLGGKKQRLADYRGKVVLLDFWYRGCGWCIKAMPQIKEVADHYRDKPVAVLGMNTDQEAADAQFVADQLKLNYPTLKAAGLPEKYGIQGFPTLIVIDPDGVVRERHVGYSPTLRDDLIRKIDGLISKGK
jgi:thiol-disulfide isomerase/thioredoxin